jgi:hypothetical protein
MLQTPELIVSSIGDLGRLDMLNEYRAGAKSNQTITVQDAICGQRMRVPALMNLLWEYDGRLSCQWFTGGEWMTHAQLQRVIEAFEGWIRRFIA